jgi:hypothetical protein
MQQQATGGGGPSSKKSPRRRSKRALPRAPVVALFFATSAFAQDEAAVDDAAAPREEAAPLSTAQLFRRGEVRFEYGDCAGAVEAFEGIAVPGVLSDEKQLVEAYRILGVCFFQLGREGDATRSLEALLYIDPEYTLDPFRTPPPVTEHFEELKATIRRKLREIEEQRRGSTEPPPSRTLLVERERLVKTTPFATVFLPFGLAQWANGEPLKGSFLGTAQGIALLANAGAGLTAVAIDLSDQKLGTAPVGDIGQRQGYTVAWAISVAALAGLVGAYAYGVADALWNREAEVEIEVREQQREVPPDEAKKMLRRLDSE